MLSGYQSISLLPFLKGLLPVSSIGDNFVGLFIIFHLTIPFLTLLVQKMNEKQHVCLLLLRFFTYVVLGTVHVITFNYVSRFIVIFLVASYVRLYSKPLFDKRGVWGLALSIASVAACAWGYKHGYVSSAYYFVRDSNTFLAVTNGFCAFMFFKNLRIPYSKVINSFGAAAFGVLLIHASSATMRKWLWTDTLHNVAMYSTALGYVHAIAAVLGIFLVCACIDMLRIRFLEKPLSALWDKKWPPIEAKFAAWGQRICTKLNIGDNQN